MVDPFFCTICSSVPAHLTLAICTEHHIGTHRSCIQCFRNGKYMAMMRCACAGINVHQFVYSAMLVDDEWERSW